MKTSVVNTDSEWLWRAVLSLIWFLGTWVLAYFTSSCWCNQLYYLQVQSVEYSLFVLVSSICMSIAQNAQPFECKNGASGFTFDNVTLPFTHWKTLCYSSSCGFFGRSSTALSMWFFFLKVRAFAVSWFSGSTNRTPELCLRCVRSGSRACIATAVSSSRTCKLRKFFQIAHRLKFDVFW